MLKLNLTTAEHLIFENRDVQKILPISMFSYFEQWRVSRQIPALRQIGKRSVLDFLDCLKDEHVALLEDFFKDRIYLEKTNYRIIENYKISLKEIEICEFLNKIKSFPNYSTWRDNDYLYISFWR